MLLFVQYSGNNYSAINEIEKAIKELEEYVDKYPKSYNVPYAKLFLMDMKAKLKESKPLDPDLIKKIEKSEQDWLAKMESADEKDINIGESALILARPIYPDMDVKDYLSEIDHIAGEIKTRIGVEKDPEKIIQIINDYLYEFRMLDFVGFSSDMITDYSEASDKSYLNTVLDTMKGNCLGLSTLYLAIGERLNLPFYGVLMPRHIFVRYDDGKFRKNIETTKKGREIPTKQGYIEWIKEVPFDFDEKWYPQLKEEGIFYRNLSKKEIIGLILQNRTRYFYRKDNIVKALQSLEMSLKFNSDAGAVLFSNLGVIYEQTGDLGKAIENLKKAKKLVPEVAWIHGKLAEMYVISERYTDAIEAYQEYLKLEPNDKDAWFSLGITYGTVKQYDKAVEIFRSLGDEGFIDAQNRLGLGYLNGLGVDKDEKEAVKWFTKAAERGNAPAQYNLGTCYYLGNGVEKDEKTALSWLRKSALQGYDEAIKILEVIGEPLKEK